MIWTIKKKLLAASAISVALTITVALVGYRGLHGMSDRVNEMLRGESQIAQHSARLRADVLGLRRYEKDMFINIDDAKKVEEYGRKFDEQGEHAKKRLDDLGKVAVAPSDREVVTKMVSDFETYMSGVRTVVAKIRAGQIRTTQDANRAVGEYKDATHRLEKHAEEFAADGNRRMADVEGVLNSQATSTLTIMAIVAAVAIGLGLGASIVISRNVSGGLAQLVARLRDIAEGEGDLTRRVDVASADETGEVAKWFNVFIEKIHGVMVEVSEGANHAQVASQQLASAAEQLAAGAQEQASSLEETAASLEEITGTVKQNADNARQANQLAVGSRDTADKGGQVVTTAVAAMGEINQASKKIADIITTIDEIAFQTNLLALNAAVEAARAGEQGRGFAVVAAEVRNLAQRSATAAKEIKSLIQDSVGKVEAGSELVNRSGQTLTEIVGSVKRVTDIIAEISAASAEQSSGIDQVNRAVSQMDQVVQSNSAQTEELSSTAQAMAAQAEQLQSLVGRFKLDRDGRAAHAGARSTPARPAAAAPMKPAVRPTARPAKAAVKLELETATRRAANGSANANDGFDEF